MAAIYLRHEKHGEKVACSEQEAAYDEANGWTRFSVVAPDPAPVAAPSVEPEPAAITYVVTETNGMQPENAMAKRRGRPRKAPVE